MNGEAFIEHRSQGQRIIDKATKKMWRNALRFSTVGLEMGIAVAIGYGVGWWLDRLWGTKPYLTLTMVLFGVAAGFRALYRAGKALHKLDQKLNGNDT